jgi:hypothetical protein
MPCLRLGGGLPIPRPIWRSPSVTVTGDTARSCPKRGSRLGSCSRSRSSSRGVRSRSARGLGDRGYHDGGRVAVGVGLWCLSVCCCVPAGDGNGYGKCGWRGAAAWQADSCGHGRGSRGGSWWNVGGEAGSRLVGRGRQPGAVVGGAALAVNGGRAGLERRLGDGFGDG